MDKILLIKILYAAASMQGLILAFMLARAGNNREANRILAVLLVIVSFHLILAVLKLLPTLLLSTTSLKPGVGRRSAFQAGSE